MGRGDLPKCRRKNPGSCDMSIYDECGWIGPCPDKGDKRPNLVAPPKAVGQPTQENGALEDARQWLQEADRQLKEYQRKLAELQETMSELPLEEQIDHSEEISALELKIELLKVDIEHMDRMGAKAAEEMGRNWEDYKKHGSRGRPPDTRPRPPKQPAYPGQRVEYNSPPSTAFNPAMTASPATTSTNSRFMDEWLQQIERDRKARQQRELERSIEVQRKLMKHKEDMDAVSTGSPVLNPETEPIETWE